MDARTAEFMMEIAEELDDMALKLRLLATEHDRETDTGDEGETADIVRKIAESQ